MKLKSSKWLLCTLSIVSLIASAQADVFGNRGQSGMSGADGMPGISGQSVTITATGQSEVLDLAGQPGGPGGNGTNGMYADRCGQPLGRADEFGARGGRGGNGGNGGRGGDGGNVTIYYTELAQLKNITVNAAPGVGGPAGIAGQGNAGCSCGQYRWAIPVQVCHEVPGPQQALAQTLGGDNERNPKPQPSHGPGPVVVPPPTSPPSPPQIICFNQLEPHFCRDGETGNNGAPGQYGSSGNLGSLVLINSPAPLTPTNQTANLQIGSLPVQSTLTVDSWATSTGAQGLLGPGSVISDSYQYWAGRKSVPVTLIWSNPRSQSLFNGQEVQISTDSSGQITPELVTSGMWAEMLTSYDQSGAATVAVTKAMLPGEATQLTGQVYGWSAGTIAKLTDAANVNQIVNTQIHATVISSGIFDHTRFDDVVPANDIQVEGPYITINIGKLPLNNGLSDLNKGKHLKVQLSITRSLGGQSANQEIDMDINSLGDQ